MRKELFDPRLLAVEGFWWFTFSNPWPFLAAGTGLRSLSPSMCCAKVRTASYAASDCFLMEAAGKDSACECQLPCVPLELWLVLVSLAGSLGKMVCLNMGLLFIRSMPWNFLVCFCSQKCCRKDAYVDVLRMSQVPKFFCLLPFFFPSSVIYRHWVLINFFFFLICLGFTDPYDLSLTKVLHCWS